MKDIAVLAEMLVQQKPVRFQIDCEASANILPSKYVEDADLEPCSQSLIMCNGTKVKPFRSCALPVVNPRNNNKIQSEILGCQGEFNSTPTEKMGLLTMHKENFVSIVENLENDLSNKYPDVFDNGLGKLPEKLKVDLACQPVILPARKVLLFKAELRRLPDLKVIAPVDQPAEWVSQFVIAVKKSGDFWACIDPNC